MKCKKINSAALVLVLTLGGWMTEASASLIKADYQHSGDGKLVYDDANQWEWLRLDAVIGQSVTSALSDYAGFRIATQAEAMSLYNSLFPGLPLYAKNAYADLTGAVYDAYDQTMSSLFGRTGISNSASYGLYQAEDGNYALMGSADLDYLGSSKVRFYTQYGNTSDKGISYASFLLLRDHSNVVVDAVPEPAGLAVFALGLIAMGLGRFRKKHQ
jgi:hypothetical protein